MFRSARVSVAFATILYLLFLAMTPPEAAAQCVIAHRGDSANAPGNTLAAIESARGTAHLVEFDVRRTRDGKLILMHNSRVNKTTGGTGLVFFMSRNVLVNMDAGGWFSPQFSGEKIPTLEEAVRESRSIGAKPLVERKSGRARLYHRAFKKMGLSPNELEMISFNRRFIRRMNRLDPDYELGVLGWGRITPWKLRRLSRMGADFVSWREKSIRSQADVDRVHNRGMKLYAWTVNEPPRMRELSRLGVDGITTDDPALLRRHVTGIVSANRRNSGRSGFRRRRWIRRRG